MDAHDVECQHGDVQRKACDVHDCLTDVLRIECRLLRVSAVWLQRAVCWGRQVCLRSACCTSAGRVAMSNGPGEEAGESPTNVDLCACDVVSAAVEEGRLCQAEHGVLG